MRYKTVGDAMTPLESVYMLDVTRKVDWDTMKEVRGVAWVELWEDGGVAWAWLHLCMYLSCWTKGTRVGGWGCGMGVASPQCWDGGVTSSVYVCKLLDEGHSCTVGGWGCGGGVVWAWLHPSITYSGGMGVWHGCGLYPCVCCV